MREILFRGKRLDNGEWVEGYYVRLYGSNGRVSRRIYTPYAEVDCGDYYPDFFDVQPSTAGQYTGLTDKNGKKIFEGDILRISWSAPRRETVYEIHEVVYSKSGFFTKRNGKLMGQVSNYISPNVNMRCEVIGTIYDNPELLEVSHE